MSIPKQITFIDENHDFLIETVKEFCGPIISTLGPGGCTVIIADDDKPLPHVTKDGVTVAESIFFADKRKQAIASLIKESARKTADAVGDGTTTSVVLASAMILGGLEKLQPISCKKDFFDGFDLAFEKVIDFLTESNVSITKDSKLLESVVKISANGDEKICKIIMSAVEAAGPDGLVNVELSDELKTSVEIKGGSSLESNTFIPTAKSWEVAGNNIELILVSGAIRENFELKQILNNSVVSKNPVVIIAKEFSDVIQNTVAINNQKKLINAVLIESEGFARVSRMDLLQDLSAIFGVPIYNTDGSTDLALSDYVNVPCVELSKAIITHNETILFRSSDVLSAESSRRYTSLKREYDELVTDTSSVIDAGAQRHLQKRLAKYNVVATIKVGGTTKAEAAEVKDRIDDSLDAITAAVNGGITQGGGMALYRAGVEIEKVATTFGLSATGTLGVLFMANCCKSPIRVLAQNAGIELTDIPFDTMEDNEVFDFRDFQVVDYLEGGIIDPALVPISALTNSSSVAKNILKSNSIISEWQDTTGV